MTDPRHKPESTDRSPDGKVIALGAGAGIVFGSAFGDPGVGLVLGAALGLILGQVLARKFR